MRAPNEVNLHEELRESIKRLTKDLKEAARTMGPAEARFLVDAYYIMQEQRKRSANQLLALTKTDEPHLVLDWLEEQSTLLERQVARALDIYGLAHALSRWARSIVGIGPIIAAGLLCHIDITKADTVGKIWRFGGVDPTSKWEKGKKRPYNSELKRLIFLIGESFTKVQSHENDVYGKVYIARKVLEWDRNAKGLLSEQAQKRLKQVKIGDATEGKKWYGGEIDYRVYRFLSVHFEKRNAKRKLNGQQPITWTTPSCAQIESANLSDAIKESKLLEQKWIKKLIPIPMLPPAHIHARAKRYAAKLFLSAYQEVAYFLHYQRLPPLPYPLAKLEGHTHYIGIPNVDLVPGLRDAKRIISQMSDRNTDSESKPARKRAPLKASQSE